MTHSYHVACIYHLSSSSSASSWFLDFFLDFPDPGFIHVLLVTPRWSLRSPSFAKDTFNTLYKMYTENWLATVMEMEFSSYSIDPWVLIIWLDVWLQLPPFLPHSPCFHGTGFSLKNFFLDPSLSSIITSSLTLNIFPGLSMLASSQGREQRLPRTCCGGAGGRWPCHTGDRIGMGASTGSIIICGRRTGLLVL